MHVVVKSMVDRRVVFLVGCIGTRMGAAIVARNMIANRPIVKEGMILAASAIAAFLLFHFIFGTRKYAFEANGLVWWNNMRPLHAMLLIQFAKWAGEDHPDAWKFLMADAVLGLYFWLNNTYFG
jgi:hypothetical protein